jgi:hypothetical protein
MRIAPSPTRDFLEIVGVTADLDHTGGLIGFDNRSFWVIENSADR